MIALLGPEVGQDAHDAGMRAKLARAQVRPPHPEGRQRGCTLGGEAELAGAVPGGQAAPLRPQHHAGQSTRIMHQSGTTYGLEMCFAPSPFGASLVFCCWGQATSRIQHTTL